MTSIALDLKEIDAHQDRLKASGCRIDFDPAAGTLRATDQDSVVVLRGTQKGKDGPWIFQWIDSERITWSR